MVSYLFWMYVTTHLTSNHEGLELSRKYPGEIDLVNHGREHAPDEGHRPPDPGLRAAGEPKALRCLEVAHVRMWYV
jgi:hypothetical protein